VSNREPLLGTLRSFFIIAKVESLPQRSVLVATNFRRFGVIVMWG
jgi:hypothetical protein